MNTPETNLNVKAIEEKLDGSVAENARKLGISRGHLHNILRGNKNPSAELLLKIQTTFGLTAKELIKQN